MTTLLHCVYFGNVYHYIALSQAEHCCFEIYDNYQKQTYRNRCYVATANGKHLLNIPIKHTSTGQRGHRTKKHQIYKDVKIENDFDWQKNHWKTLQIAYRSSPFFEFYEDDLYSLFNKKYTYLIDVNQHTFEIITDLLGIDNNVSFTTTYRKEPEGVVDLRHLTNVKKEKQIELSPYTQVLEENHGFLPNLSILDLLFNKGPEALSYLQAQHISISDL